MTDQPLDVRAQNFIPIAAFTASGELDKLKPALNKALDTGLTINEIKEVLTQLYAYAGFPRSLNALFSFMAVIKERQDQGIEDVEGREASPVAKDLDKDEYGAKVRARLAGLDTVPPPAEWMMFAPLVDRFLKEHLFADIFARDLLSSQDRELVTIAALANMTGTADQLQFHLGAAMNTGLSKAQLEDFILVFAARVDPKKSVKAADLLTTVLQQRDAL